MKRKHLFITILLAFLFWDGLHAQTGSIASGGDATGSGGTVNYSIGQTDYITSVGSGNAMTQGLQQPYEIFILTMIDEANKVSLDCIAYPNPTEGDITLKVENYNLNNSAYQLFDLDGKLLLEEKIANSESCISLKYLENAIYILKIVENANIIKSFKITKTY